MAGTRAHQHAQQDQLLQQKTEQLKLQHAQGELQSFSKVSSLSFTSKLPRLAVNRSQNEVCATSDEPRMIYYTLSFTGCKLRQNAERESAKYTS